MSVYLKKNIEAALQGFSTGNLTDQSLKLFKTLGYKTDRQNPFDQKSFQCFKDSFLDGNTRFDEKKAFVSEWKYMDLLFQLSKEEMSAQVSLFDTGRVDNTVIESYLFFAIELEKAEYSRSALAQITREVNKVFPMPVLIVFKHGTGITLSVINRRLNKKDDRKDVLEKVTVIKDISIEKPHRAHIEILFDLSFEELRRVQKFVNFVELHNAWQKTLDTKELNKRFYRELSNWYFWAIHEVLFPASSLEGDKKGLFQKDDKVREHNAKNLIRLLTRILFVWFIKEKNLIPDELFDEKYIKEHLINNFEPSKKIRCSGAADAAPASKYYRAILQNLFFATLNQTVGKREFRKDGQQMNVTNLMRYESYFKNPKAFLKLVEDVVPFMNGGLFECLDTPDPVLKGKKGGDVIIYEDGFSDRKDNTLCVPDYIFFGTGEHADLSEELGDKKQKDVTVSGLINILKSYKFTVTENTPIEEDIALDPELLGRVFENLLASYNPETKTTARKQTGSFYTPREIVNYMVDESLKAYLQQKLESEAGMKPEDAEIGLEILIGYNEKEHIFDEKQIAVLINSIDTCKILDPATGSGAFPMGILHKLVHILHKLDPKNKLWKERQIKKARAIDDAAIRDQLIEDIETAFANNELDYGRKLYLIENCIYGVDIQPIAIQICKLRFFISLIVDQKSEKAKDNFGIRPLPNLETKFVAANTLIGIEKPKQQLKLFNHPEVVNLEEKLKDVRHRLFSAKTPATKRKLREEDQKLREQMGKILEDSGWSNESARLLAGWDPYDQNASSPFFDSEWMFAITNGFDVVIGNPPYMIIQTLTEAAPELIKSYKQKYKSATGKFDLYCLFTEKGISLIRETGILNYIMPSKWTVSSFGIGLREIISKNNLLFKFISFDSFQVFNASTYSSLVWLRANKGNFAKTIKLDKDLNNQAELAEWLSNEVENKMVTINTNTLSSAPWTLSNESSNKIILELKKHPAIIEYLDGVFQGIVTGDNDVYWLHDCQENNGKISCFSKALNKQVTLESSLVFPFLNGKTIGRFQCKTNNTYILYPYKKRRNKTELLSEQELSSNYPQAYLYLIELKERLENRGSETMSYPSWYSLWNQRSYERLQKKNKILTPDVCNKGCMWKDRDGYYFHADTSYAIIVKDEFREFTNTLYCILNSSLLWFYLQNTGAVQRGGFFRFKTSYIKPFPVPYLKQKNASIFDALESFMAALSIFKQNKIQLFFESLADAMVYELYFPDEIKAASGAVLEILTNLPELKDDWSDEKKIKTIEIFYKELSDPAHPVSIAMEKQKTVPEVRIIEGIER